MSGKLHPKTGPLITRYQRALDLAARVEILAALGETKGNRLAAAKLLGLTPNTLFREINRLALWDALDKEASERGWTERKGGFGRGKEHYRNVTKPDAKA